MPLSCKRRGFCPSCGGRRATAPLVVYGVVLCDVGSVEPSRAGERRGYRFIDGSHPDHETIAGAAPPGSPAAARSLRPALGPTGP